MFAGVLTFLQATCFFTFWSNESYVLFSRSFLWWSRWTNLFCTLRRGTPSPTATSRPRSITSSSPTDYIATGRLKDDSFAWISVLLGLQFLHLPAHPGLLYISFPHNIRFSPLRSTNVQHRFCQARPHCFRRMCSHCTWSSGSRGKYRRYIVTVALELESTQFFKILSTQRVWTDI